MLLSVLVLYDFLCYEEYKRKESLSSNHESTTAQILLGKFLRNLISLLICYNLGISPWVSNMWWVMGVLCYRVLSTGSVFWWWPPLCVQRALWSSSSCLSWTRENGDGEMKILVWSSLVLSLQVCISTVKAPYWWKEGTSDFFSVCQSFPLFCTYLFDNDLSPWAILSKIKYCKG